MTNYENFGNFKNRGNSKNLVFSKKSQKFCKKVSKSFQNVIFCDFLLNFKRNSMYFVNIYLLKANKHLLDMFFISQNRSKTRRFWQRDALEVDSDGGVP